MAQARIASVAGASPATGDVVAIDPPSDAKALVPFGIAALLGVIASVFTCYSSFIVLYFFGIAKLGLNAHVQAVVMCGLALFAAFALWRDRRRHGSNIPFILGAAGAAILIATIYVSYNNRVETLSYLLLVSAVFINQNFFLNALNRTVRRQAREIDELNQSLARKVEHQGQEIDRLERLKQFLAPQVADLVVSDGGEKLLATHRRYIACLFCDIRDFTSVSEHVDPEETIAILQTFHDRIGGLVIEHRGTIGFRAGDGLMVFFNDPVPCDAPVLDAVKLALRIRAAFEEIRAPWLKLGHSIGLGIGIASGYATLGLVGFKGRADYTAIGGAINIASRLCDRAVDGQILVSHRAYIDIEPQVRAERLGAVELKGVGKPVETHSILAVAAPSSGVEDEPTAHGPGD